MALKEYRLRSVRVVYEDWLEGLERPRYLVTGFKGYGLVGYIATLYLAEKLGCRRAGVILTKYMPEAITLDDKGLIVAPFELYSCSHGDKSITIIVNHDLPVDHERTRFVEALVKWATGVMGFDEAVFIGGFNAGFRQGEEKLRWLKTRHCKRELSEPLMERGLYVIGPLALLILFADLYGLPALVLLPYADAERPDPRAAAVAVEKINELLGLSVDTRELLAEAERIEEMVAKLEKQREALMQPREAERVYM